MMIGITQSTSILGKHKQNLIWRENIHSKTARSNYETQKWLPFLHRVSAPHLTLHTPELISDWLWAFCYCLFKHLYLETCMLLKNNNLRNMKRWIFSPKWCIALMQFQKQNVHLIKYFIVLLNKSFWYIQVECIMILKINHYILNKWY